PGRAMGTAVSGLSNPALPNDAPPAGGSGSTTATSTPARRNHSAVESPATPAPITIAPCRAMVMSPPLSFVPPPFGGLARGRYWFAERTKEETAMPKILFTSTADEIVQDARDMLPEGYELIVAAPGSAAYAQGLAEADYLIGNVQGMNDSFY